MLRQAPAVGRQQTTAHCHSLTNSCWDTRRDVTRLWTFIPVAVSWLPTPPRPPPRRLHSRVGSHTGGRTGSWEEKWSTVADQTTTTTTPTNTISSTTTTTAPTTVPESPPLLPPPPPPPPPPKRTDPSRSAKSGHTEPVCTAASASPAVICEHPLFLSALRPPPSPSPSFPPSPPLRPPSSLPSSLSSSYSSHAARPSTRQGAGMPSATDRLSCSVRSACPGVAVSGGHAAARSLTEPRPRSSNHTLPT